MSRRASATSCSCVSGNSIRTTVRYDLHECPKKEANNELTRFQRKNVSRGSYGTLIGPFSACEFGGSFSAISSKLPREALFPRPLVQSGLGILNNVGQQQTSSGKDRGLGKVEVAFATERCQGTGRHDISSNVHLQITARWASASLGASVRSQIFHMVPWLESQHLALRESGNVCLLPGT